MVKTPEYDKLVVYFSDDGGSGRFRGVSAGGRRWWPSSGPDLRGRNVGILSVCAVLTQVSTSFCLAENQFGYSGPVENAESFTEQRRHVHAYVDRLPGDHLLAVRGLLEAMLSPLDRGLALAPLDDEPVTEEDAAAIQAGTATLDAGRYVPMEEVLADFGLTMDDFQKMADTRPAKDHA